MMERYNSTFMVDVWKELFANAIIPLCGEALVQVQQPNSGPLGERLLSDTR